GDFNAGLLSGRFKLETWFQPRAGLKVLATLGTSGRPNLGWALSGDRTWVLPLASTEPRYDDPPDPELVEQLSEWAYVSRVLRVLPLLKEPGFVLTARGETVVSGRPALTVRVSSRGRHDLLLSFDKG